MNMKSRRAPLRGMALLPTLVLLFIIAAMIAAALQENIAQRTHLKTQKEALQALYLAESGVQEALHRLAASPEAGSLARDVERGSVATEWAPADGGFRIVSVGIGLRTAPEVTRRRVTVDVQRVQGEPAGAATLRVTGWKQDN